MLKQRIARTVLPGAAVAAVLAFSYFAPVSALTGNQTPGNSAGYGNNCGVKGTGYHDHGKPCPNRPFPGQGKGITIALESSNAASVAKSK